MPVVYRIDKFVVPAPARDEFWANVRRTHSVLRDQPGFLADTLLEQRSGSGRFNAVTIVKWSSEDDLAAAKSAVDRSHEAAQFQPVEFFERVGIEADLANYVDIDAEG
ncbi:MULTISPECIES: antibiotic biosynthesis monooxygenase [unclassified Nocardia]|uniref:antibiotic biosynthesis monooxygenase family protein n=1 Tax=unclassified Nocardia TaxID=2637762 RepID=UPI001CE43EDA|nr:MULTISPECIES: antibiotic biosynthesis monooxygenase [unclassified Nocardia]